LFFISTQSFGSSSKIIFDEPDATLIAGFTAAVLFVLLIVIAVRLGSSPTAADVYEKDRGRASSPCRFRQNPLIVPPVPRKCFIEGGRRLVFAFEHPPLSGKSSPSPRRSFDLQLVGHGHKNGVIKFCPTTEHSIFRCMPAGSTPLRCSAKNARFPVPRFLKFIARVPEMTFICLIGPK